MLVEPILKHTLGLAAEFVVASELCRRSIYAQLTLGNRKRTDLLVEAENGMMLCVQVKAKQNKVWPAVKGISGRSMILVLVDYEKKTVVERPDFLCSHAVRLENIRQQRTCKSPFGNVING